MTLRVYGWQSCRPGVGLGVHNQTREICAAQSKAEVARIVGVRAPRLLFNLGETGNDEERAAALAQPGRVLWRGLDDWGKPWRT